MAIILGILVITLGMFNIRTKNPILLHSYHRKNVSGVKSESLAIQSGIGLILVGISVVIIFSSDLYKPNWNCTRNNTFSNWYFISLLFNNKVQWKTIFLKNDGLA